MKHVCMVWMFVMGVLSTKAQLINLDQRGGNSTITLSTSKTTSLIFPFAIKFVDRGTRDVLVQQVKEAQNMLLVKAGKAYFEETNLSVVTQDGLLHSFLVRYDEAPKLWVYHFAYSIPVLQPFIKFIGEDLNKAQIQAYANAILEYPPFLFRVKDKKWNTQLKLEGLYSKEDVLFFQLLLDNTSSLDYDLSAIRFYIRNNKKAKRVAVQEQELLPLEIEGNIEKVKSGCQNKVVIALPRFTLAEGKHLVIAVREKSGGRHLLLRLNNNKLIKAKKLSSIL